MNRDTDTQIVRRSLFRGNLFDVEHLLGRPSSSACGEVEYPSLNVLVLPMAGVFAMHHGPRRHVVATPNHAVFISAGSPYRVSFPGGIGDECMTLRLSSAGLARLLPEAMAGDGFDSSAFASHALLPPETMLARSLLWNRFVRGEAEPLLVEELGIGLLTSSLRIARKTRAGERLGASRGTGSKMRYVEFVKEAVATSPARKWTLGELAGLAGVSPCHLAHVFNEKVGTSIYHYMLRLRLAGALDAVLDSDADLTGIALEAGFASHSHFTSRFRALFGLAPSELRRCASSGKVAALRKIVTAHQATTA